MNVSPVKAQLSGDPAYTTAMSTAARLAEKGVLDRVMGGRAFRYELAAPDAAIGDCCRAADGPAVDRCRRSIRRVSEVVADLAHDKERMPADLLDNGRLSRKEEST
jgi:predicted transcriptional regulator